MYRSPEEAMSESTTNRAVSKPFVEHHNGRDIRAEIVVSRRGGVVVWKGTNFKIRDAKYAEISAIKEWGVFN